MRILGIDFGLKKIGFSLANAKIAEPYLVIRYQNLDDLLGKIKALVYKEQIEKIIVGVSEGEMGRKSEDFSNKLRKILKIPVGTFDETLSTYDAKRLALDAGIKKAKRKSMEDAFASCVMLQSFLDKD